MERCDFCSVMAIIRRYISDDRNMSQTDLLYELFASFFNQKEAQDFYLDNGLVCRWMNGLSRISPRISGFYFQKKHKPLLTRDISDKILPILYDSAMAIEELHTLLMQDATISEKVKTKYSKLYPCQTDGEEAAFLCGVLCFGMEREFVKRDANYKALLAGGSLSPMVRNFVMAADVPNPCRYFCGREQELEQLHQMLQNHGKLFLWGIAGIGKSEMAKAYAKQHKKEYTNILYLSYTGDLARDIAEMDFVDDLASDQEAERFRKHNRFLRSLKEDTLLVIDHFNTTASQESTLSVVMKYRCRVLFTTRSRFDQYAAMELKEIADQQTLLNFARCFYADAAKYQPILEQIIQVVHSHTLAVELASRLLQTGILEPGALLNKLKEERAAMDAADKIGITKDGQSRRATYYDHIHTLFSLYQLNSAELDVMRSLIFTPDSGIPVRLLARWMQLADGNTIHDLVENGFVQASERYAVALHPMIREVAITETKPTVTNCRTLLTSLHTICQHYEADVPYFRLMFQTIDNLATYMEIDDTAFYLRFLEDAFSYMQKYGDTVGMKRIVSELYSQLQDQSIGTVTDRVLFLDCCAACETRTRNAIQLEQGAVALLGDVTPENARLAANLHANLGSLYQGIGEVKLAKQHMEIGMNLLKQYGMSTYYDMIPKLNNYAVLRADMGEVQDSLQLLQTVANAIRQCSSDQSGDYAQVQETMGNVALLLGDGKRAARHFKKAMSIYEVLFAAEPERIAAKKEEIFRTYVQAGAYLAQQILKK